MSENNKGEPIYEYDAQGNKKIVGYKTKDDGTRRIEVSVDTEQISELIKEKQELKEKLEEKTTELEDRETKLRLIAEKILEKKREELMKYAESEAEKAQIKTMGPKALMAYGKTIESKLDSSRATLTDEQLSSEKRHIESKGEFESYEELIDYLREKAQSNITEEKLEAERTINELFKKVIQGAKEQPQRFTYEAPIGVRTSDLLNKWYRKWKTEDILMRKREKESEKK